MDDLDFRRQVYADPQCKEQAVREAAEKDPAKQQFWNELKNLDADIQKAAKIPVPDHLKHQLILRQSITSHRQQKKRNRIHLALAASVAFALGLSFTIIKQQPDFTNVSEVALAHIHHESEYTMSTDNNVGLEEVTAKLASFGGTLTEPLGKVRFANYCYFENQKTLHLVLETSQGQITVFVTPKEEGELVDQYFQDEKYVGTVVEYPKVNLVFLTEKNMQIRDMARSIENKLNFSA